MAVELISKIKPKNNGSFPLVDAVDVEMPDGSRLSEFQRTGATPLFVMIQRNEDGSYTADKSYMDIHLAYIEHRTIYAMIGWILDRPLARLVVAPVGSGTCEFYAHLSQGFFRISIRADGVITVEITSGASGGGEDGGYYVPKVAQLDANTARVAFESSKSGMQEIPHVDITLPTGPQGPQGPAGADGAKGDKGDTGATGPAYSLTDADKNTIAAAVKASLPTENWTFTLEDGSTVTKAVHVG